MDKKTILYAIGALIVLVVLYVLFKPAERQSNQPRAAHQDDAVKLVEPLLGFMLTEQGLEFQVTSGGCTEKSDFQIEILESYPMQLHLIRIKEDWCKALLPRGETISFTYDELGLSEHDEFSIVNPLSVMIVPMKFNNDETNK